MMSLTMWPLMFLAQAPTGAAPPTGTVANPANLAGDPGVHSLWGFVVKGGPVMVIIGLCSLVALAIIIERLIVLRRSRVVPRAVVAEVRAVIGDRHRAIETCRNNSSPIARVLEAALVYADGPVDLQDRRVEETGQRELLPLRHRMRLLSALPQVSTLLGLLGTIFGMIKTFQVVATTGQALGKTEMLAKGIFEAWTCTAAGLLVAIIVLVMYHVLMGRIDSLVAEVDRVASDFLEEFRGEAKPSAQLAGAVTSNGETLKRPSMDGSATQPEVAAV